MKTQSLNLFIVDDNNLMVSALKQFLQNRFGLENESEVVYDEDGNGSITRFNNEGIPQTFKAGVYFSDKIGKKKKTKIGFNYTFNDSRINSISANSSQFFLSDTTYFTNDSTLREIDKKV